MDKGCIFFKTEKLGGCELKKDMCHLILYIGRNCWSNHRPEFLPIYKIPIGDVNILFQIGLVSIEEGSRYDTTGEKATPSQAS